MTASNQDGGRMVDAATDDYTPTANRIDADAWEQVADLARTAVRRCEGIAYDTARGYMGRAAGLLAWTVEQPRSMSTMRRCSVRRRHRVR